MLKNTLIASLCCLLLVACGDSSQQTGDMSDMDESQTMAEGHDDAMHDMEEGSDEGGAGAMAGAAAGAAAGADEASMSGDEQVDDAVADVAKVGGAAAGMDVPPIELNVGEVELPDYGWTLKWFGSNDINQDPGAAINLRFAVGTLAGNSGCNEYNGSYERGEGERSVMMGEIGSTRKMCPEEVMGVEQRYLGMLGAVSRYEFKKDLYLYTPSGDWLHFYPEQPEGE
jgi:heat shock protein HslJ